MREGIFKNPKKAPVGYGALNFFVIDPTPRPCLLLLWGDPFEEFQ
jgi:hypothetical protein